MLLSVIMPVYNVEDTVTKAIESVLNQTMKDLELILVNDGSTDKSGEICDRYTAENTRVQVIHKKNGGLSSARNAGLDKASGKYVTFIDSDDYLEPHIYEQFNAHYKKETMDLFFFNICRIRNNKEVILQSENIQLRGSKEIIEALFDYKGVDFYAWNKIYRKELFSDIRYPEGRLYEDIIPSYEVAKKSSNAIVTDQVGYYYIDNVTSIVNSQFNPKQYDNVLQREILLKKIETEFPELIPKALEKLLDGYLSTGFKIASSVKSKDTVQYISKIRADIRSNQKFLFTNKQINKAKLIALLLLKFNMPLYAFMYKKVLKK